jgi:hypothetical protein
MDFPKIKSDLPQVRAEEDEVKRIAKMEADRIEAEQAALQAQEEEDWIIQVRYVFKGLSRHRRKNG